MSLSPELTVHTLTDQRDEFTGSTVKMAAMAALRSSSRTLLAPSSRARFIATDTVRIVGHGMTPLGKQGLPATELMQDALQRALASSGLHLSDLDGLIAVPSLADPRFMQAHYLATRIGLLPGHPRRQRAPVRVRTIDTGGAGPVSGLLEAVRMVRTERCRAVAVVAGDAVASLDAADFLSRADSTCQDPAATLPSPCIPHGYDRVARWQIGMRRATREQLAMCSVLMSRQASRHPLALTRRPRTLDEVRIHMHTYTHTCTPGALGTIGRTGHGPLGMHTHAYTCIYMHAHVHQVLSAPSVAPVTGLLECARRADGGAAIIVASSTFMDKVSRVHTYTYTHTYTSSSHRAPFWTRSVV